MDRITPSIPLSKRGKFNLAPSLCEREGWGELFRRRTK